VLLSHEQGSQIYSKTPVRLSKYAACTIYATKQMQVVSDEANAPYRLYHFVCSSSISDASSWSVCSARPGYGTPPRMTHPVTSHTRLRLVNWLVHLISRGYEMLKKFMNDGSRGPYEDTFCLITFDNDTVAVDMQDIVQPNAWVAFQLPSESLRVIQVLPNTYVSKQ
jgi:hypothetical protein